MIKIPKIWRGLSKEEKQEIPSKIFNLDEKEIKRIRSIEDPKKKLIESAKLQYETFKDIHSYLTVWIAGYNSDVIIRNKFQSTKKLLDLFFKISYPKEIKCSWADIKRKVKIPEEINEDLAEETGIHIGDGNIYISKGKFKSYKYGISGDLRDESLYHEVYIKELLKRLYGIYPTIIKRENKNSIDSLLKSKAIVEFKTKVLKLSPGEKTNIMIPEEILKNHELSKKCVRGIIDTDFSITNSLAITGKMNNLFVIQSLEKIFKENKIKHILRIYKNYGRFYISKEGASKIINDWQLKNKKHTSKVGIFKEFKIYLPYSSTTERIAVLNGDLDINNLKEICKKRSDKILRSGKDSNLRHHG